MDLTKLYNVLEAIRAGATLDREGEDVRARGRVLILKDSHERLDAAVVRARLACRFEAGGGEISDRERARELGDVDPSVACT